MYTLEIHDYGLECSPVADIKESSANNLSELQDEIDKWLFKPAVIMVLKNGRRICDIYYGVIQCCKNTIIN